MGMKITKKQKQLLDYISEFLNTHDYSPSYREIAAGLGLSSVSSIAEHVDNLVALGALKRTAGAARSLEVVDTSYPETTLLFKQRLITATPEEKEVLKNAADILNIDLSADEVEVENV